MGVYGHDGHDECGCPGKPEASDAAGADCGPPNVSTENESWAFCKS